VTEIIKLLNSCPAFLDHYTSAHLMKTIILGLFSLIIRAQLSFGQREYPPLNPTKRTFSAAEQEIINLSKEKWQWMADKKTDTLKNFFLDKAMFVHMGGSWGKDQEVNIIKTVLSGTRRLIFIM
jgi:hypothetical protein